MVIEQIVDIPANRRIAIEVPQTVPVGKNVLSFTPVPGGEPRSSASAAGSTKTANPKRKPISHYFGILSPETYGDPVAYQRKLRDEWDD